MITHENLLSLVEEIMSALKDAGYATYTIRNWYFPVFKALLEYSEERTFSNFEELYRDFTSSCTKELFLCKAKTAIGNLAHFAETGSLANGKKNRLGKGKPANSISEEFLELLELYRSSQINKNLTMNTINSTISCGETFFRSMQQQGFQTLDAITIQACTQFFIGDEGKNKKDYSFRKRLSWILKACDEYYPSGICKKVLGYFPKIKSARKNIQFLTKEEKDKIASVLHSPQVPLTKRDRAIGLLALYSALRSSDIANLKQKNFDWKHDTITIVQCKTSKPLVLPLSACIGNAIIEYLLEERPAVDLPEIFVSERRPYRPISTSTCYEASVHIMACAEVRMDKNQRKGLHLFRHSIATEMLAKGIPITTISEVLGHKGPLSSQVYLSVDFHHLKQCSLSIERFPIREEVLA
ncbi:MAG: tyrosine-type recombinase/integrase [Spirochaetales bacterium]|nr:tyrosine-type recombinase/integrase [Spirochaetales bacterium]